MAPICCVFILIFQITGLVQGDVIQGPDIAILAERHGNVELTCEAIIHEEDNGIRWKAGTKTVYQTFPKTWDPSHIKERNKYQPSKSSSHTYILHVNRVDPDDAKIYTCEMVQNVKHKRHYDMFVFEQADLKFKTAKEEGKNIAGECIAKYYRPQELSEEDEDIEVEVYAHTRLVGTPKQTKEQKKSGIYEIKKEFSFIADRADNAKIINCTIGSKKSPRNISSTYQMNIAYHPRVISIPNQRETYRVGDVLQCTADGNPPPLFQWESISQNKRSVITGPNLFIFNNLTGSQTWNCSCPNYPSVKHAVISFDIQESEPPLPTQAYLQGIVAILTAVVIIITEVLFKWPPTGRWKVKRKGKMEYRLGTLGIDGLELLGCVALLLTGILCVTESINLKVGIIWVIISILFILVGHVLELFLKIIEGKLDRFKDDKTNYGGEQPSEIQNEISLQLEENKPLLIHRIDSTKGPSEDESQSSKEEEPVHELLPIEKDPHCLVYKDELGKLKYDENVLEQLGSIESKLVVVAITGLYRTGKSYLMNRLAGQSHGFELGATIEKKTKGIWIWARTHPHRHNTKLILLDTEGLGDPEQRATADDKWIYTLATLLSSTLIHNAHGAVNEDMITAWNFVSELNKKINMKQNDPLTSEFDLYAPNLVVTLRDFALMLSKGDQEITANDYLEGLLDMKKDRKAQYNETRGTIRKYFKNRQCFIFDTPAPRSKLQYLETLPKEQISPEFIEDVSRFTKFVFTECEPMHLQNGHPVNGHSLAILIKYCVDAVRQDELVHLDKAMNRIVEEETIRGVEAGIKEYIQRMDEIHFSKVKDEEAFKQLHLKARQAAMQAFIGSLATEPSKLDRKIFTDDIQKLFSTYDKKIREMSRQKCQTLLEAIQSPLSDKNAKGLYNKPGGFNEYQKDMEEVREKYFQHTDLGIEVHACWSEFSSQKLTESYRIQDLDSSLTNKEELAKERNLQEISEARRRRGTSEPEVTDLPDMDDIVEQDDKMIEAAKRERQKQVEDKFKKIQEKRIKERERLQNEGFTSEAEVLQKQIEDANEEFYRKDESKKAI